MRQERQYCVYIITNKYNTVLYTGMTSDLSKRVWAHKEKIVKGFTSRYRINKLVYYESTTEVMSAIAREKQIKKYSRKKKDSLIIKENPSWRDLSDYI